MKILHYIGDDFGSCDSKTGSVLRVLEECVCKYAYLVPRGWRFILKAQVIGDVEPYYHLDVQSNRGGGSYAEAKMSTLELFSEKAATGGDDIQTVIEMCEKRGANVSFLSLIKNLSAISNMTREKSDFMRDQYGIASMWGGVRIPYEDLIVDGNKITTETGEIRIAFSGASQEQDLFFALTIFKALQATFVELYPNIQGWFNLRKLEEIPTVKLWLDLIGIKEA